MPESLAESELFGLPPGTFAGPAGKPGLVGMANRGDHLPRRDQRAVGLSSSEALHFLGDGRFRRLGGGRELHADVRPISPCDLEQRVADKPFREDLPCGLGVFRLDVPPAPGAG